MKKFAGSVPEHGLVFRKDRLLRAGAVCDKYWEYLAPSARRNVLQAARSALNKVTSLQRVKQRP